MSLENRYGSLHRLLHRWAFTTPLVQEALADLEDQLFSDRIGSAAPGTPVFISGLPRSGTTILLNTLHESGHFAAHNYRDMPFVLCPLLWQRFSARFAASDRPTERAHGDGLQVSLDSVESFEEVLWRRFWPEHYAKDRIHPWTTGEHRSEFDRFFAQHIRKISVLRGPRASTPLRYLSKNNVNISRLAGLQGPLAGGIVVVPFREPLEHAASMFRQHLRFLEIHRRDGFSLQYMMWVGHREFGLALRPVDFASWLSDAPASGTLEFWLRYWVAAYGHVLHHRAPNTLLLSYDELTERPEEVLERLELAVALPYGSLVRAAPSIRKPRSHGATPDRVPASLHRQASEQFEELLEVQAASTLQTEVPAAGPP